MVKRIPTGFKWLQRLSVCLAKKVLRFLGNLTAIVITVAVLLGISRIFMPVEYVIPDNTIEEERAVTYKVGVQANPLYELAGQEIPGTINAFAPIEGIADPEKEIHPYQKDRLKMIPNWDTEHPEAKGRPSYVRYGFLEFNHITGLKEYDVLVFSNLNFGEESPMYISLQIAKEVPTGGVVSFYLDKLQESHLFAIFDVTTVPMGKGETDFFPVTEKIGRGKSITGSGHTLYMVVEEAGLSIGQIRFGREPGQSSLTE